LCYKYYYFYYNYKYSSKKYFICVRNIESIIESRGDHFRFGSVFIKKKPNRIKKKNRNRFKLTGFGSVRFFGQKPVQTGLAQFFKFDSVFSGLARFFSGLARFFFRFLFVWVRFSFFSFRLIKLKPNRTGRFFQNFNRFFFMVRFFQLFFSVFSI